MSLINLSLFVGNENEIGQQSSSESPSFHAQDSQFMQPFQKSNESSCSSYATSQNVPIPDCPTPDSTYSGTESFKSTSICAISPVSVDEYEFDSRKTGQNNSMSESYNNQATNSHEYITKQSPYFLENLQGDVTKCLSLSRQFPFTHLSSSAKVVDQSNENIYGSSFFNANALASNIAKESIVSNGSFKTSSSKSKGKQPSKAIVDSKLYRLKNDFSNISNVIITIYNFRI